MGMKSNSKAKRPADQSLRQSMRSSRNKLNQAQARLRRLKEHPKQVKPIITARWLRRHPEDKTLVRKPSETPSTQ